MSARYFAQKRDNDAICIVGDDETINKFALHAAYKILGGRLKMGLVYVFMFRTKQKHLTTVHYAKLKVVPYSRKIWREL